MDQKFLDNVRYHLGLSDETFSKYLDKLDKAAEIIEKNGVKFTYEFQLVFYSHIVSYCQRLEKKESLNMKNSGFEEEIDKTAYKISLETLTMLANEYNTTPDELEVILAAIQIQLALELQNQ